jgi:hypothetical protein
LSTYEDRLAEGQVGGGSGVRSGHIGGGLVDLSGFTLGDLREMQDSYDDESSLSRALSRVLASKADGSNGFNARI